MTQKKLEPFPCTSCGKCCENVHLSSLTIHLDQGDGSCRHLDASTKLCTIYDDRPDICRVDLQYRESYQQIYSWNEFVALNLKSCEILLKK